MERDGFAGGAPPEPDAITTLEPGLTLAARVAFYAMAALSIAALVATWNEIGAFDEFRRVGTEAAIVAVGEAEQLSEGFVTFVLYVAAASGVLTIVWWHRAYRAAMAADPKGTRWSPGWAIGGWFLPLANLVIPKLVLDEIDRVSQAVRDGDRSWRTRARTTLTGWWWGLWVGGLILGLYGSSLVAQQLDAPTFDPGVYRSGLMTLLAAHAATVGASFCAAASLRVLGDRLHRPQRLKRMGAG